MSDPERQRRAEEVCDSALDLHEGDRAAFVAAACGDDDVLRQDVESLLAHAQKAEGFLATPVGELAAQIMADEQEGSLLGGMIADRLESVLSALEVKSYQLPDDTTLAEFVIPESARKPFG